MFFPAASSDFHVFVKVVVPLETLRLAVTLLVSPRASRAPHSSVDRNGCVTVKLVSFFHVEFKRGLSRLLLLRQSSPSLCLIENRPAPVGGC